MEMKRIGWKVLFFIMLATTLAGTFSDLTSPDILKPTHPIWISILVMVSDYFLLVSSYCYAFEKYIIRSINFWKVMLSISIFSNLTVFYYAYSRPGAYQLDEVAVSLPISIATLIIFSLPTYLYFSQDLKKGVVR
ncbi:hypothetical protein [Gallaecimonas pentaromativorans]|uniref:hypothetical protein n=1 Tax=Gallaecimonas pentaromativorans TaxID=584787 RepID=UPI0011CE8C5C|nr:hypothetical protein [Gallaecimonas pentaromativorans]